MQCRITAHDAICRYHRFFRFHLRGDWQLRGPSREDARGLLRRRPARADVSHHRNASCEQYEHNRLHGGGRFHLCGPIGSLPVAPRAPSYRLCLWRTIFWHLSEAQQSDYRSRFFRRAFCVSRGPANRRMDGDTGPGRVPAGGDAGCGAAAL